MFWFCPWPTHWPVSRIHQYGEATLRSISLSHEHFSDFSLVNGSIVRRAQENDGCWLSKSNKFYSSLVVPTIFLADSTSLSTFDPFLLGGLPTTSILGLTWHLLWNHHAHSTTLDSPLEDTSLLCPCSPFLLVDSFRENFAAGLFLLSLLHFTNSVVYCSIMSTLNLLFSDYSF